MSIEKTYARYAPSLNSGKGNILQLQDVAAASLHFERQSRAGTRQWVLDRTQTFTTPSDRPYQLVVDRPYNGDDNQALVYTMPFMNRPDAGSVEFARFVRNEAMPDATLVIQPTVTYEQNAMNFSRDEIKGDISRAAVGRVVGGLEQIFGKMPENTAILGVSSGADLGYALGASGELDKVELTAVESPTITERNLAKLGADFLTCCKELKDVVKSNFDNPDNTPFAQEWLEDMDFYGRPDRMARGLFIPANVAMAKTFRHATVADRTRTMLAAGNVVTQVNGDVDKVSPAEANHQVAAEFVDNLRFDHIVLRGSDHGLGLAAAPMMALVRHTRAKAQRTAYLQP